MNLKYLYGSIVIIFLVIVFVVPLSKEDSKSKKIVNEITETTKEIISKEKEEIIVKKDFEKQKVKTFDEVFVEPFKDNTLKKVQIKQELENNEEKVENAFTKLDKILDEKNIKLKKIEPSIEEKEIITKKIEKIKKDFEKINN